MKLDKGFKKIWFLTLFFIGLGVYNISPFLLPCSWAIEGEPKQGWKIFYQKGCLNCHTIWSIGDRGGIELTGLAHNSISIKGLTAKHRRYISQIGVNMVYPKKPLSFNIMGEEIPDLISFLKFIQALDGPGNPLRGKSVLAEKRCNSCHNKIAPDLTQKAKFANPVLWITQMWNHAPAMKKVMNRTNIPWPRFKGDDLVDLMAYIRKLSPPEEKVYLTLGDPKKGERVIRQNTCLSCHSIFGKGGNTGPEFTLINQINKEAPRTFGQVAGLMWNHFPEMEQEMKNKGLVPAKLSERDMGNITAYLISIQKFKTERDIAAVKKQP